MPYFVIELEDEVYADGEKGKVIAIGNPANKSAHYLVRLSQSKRDVWFSRDEVVPAWYQERKE